jgi:hypothetical protein
LALPDLSFNGLNNFPKGAFFLGAEVFFFALRVNRQQINRSGLVVVIINHPSTAPFSHARPRPTYFPYAAGAGNFGPGQRIDRYKTNEFLPLFLILKSGSMF